MVVVILKIQDTHAQFFKRQRLLSSPLTMKPLLLILTSCIFVTLAGCVTPNTGTYPVLNTNLGEIQDWRMRLFREPGRIDVKMRLVKGTYLRVALETPNEREKAPIQLLFTGCDCSNDLDASLRYSTESDVFAFKYFSKALDRNKDVTVRIEWDEEMRTWVSIGDETIQVKPHLFFGTLHVTTENGSVQMTELGYSKLAEVRERAKGVKR